MLVHGAIIPPRSVLEAVAAVVRSVPEPVEAAASASARGVLGRFGRRKEEASEPEGPTMLEQVPFERMHFPITGFGNLTTGDSRRLLGAISKAAADWAAPTVRLAGGTALDFPGDWSVWARAEGDVDALGAVARGVTQSVQALGFFVDRRQFRPMLSVATVTPATTGPFLESVVNALATFRSEDWTAAISLTTESFVDGRSQMVEFERIPLD
jgi:2'-5' RNA ligase